LDDRVPLVIEIIGQKGILEADIASGGMDCDCTNGRDSPMRIRDAMYWGLPPRCIGAPDDGLKHKTCFVDENEVGSPCSRRVSDAGKRFLYPPPDRNIISILVVVLRPLARPIQVFLQDPANVSRMIPNPEMRLDDLGDSPGRPEVIEPAVCRGPLRK
jgi:hypothetical protein